MERKEGRKGGREVGREGGKEKGKKRDTSFFSNLKMDSQEHKLGEDAALPMGRRYGKNVSFPVFVQEASEGNNEVSFHQSLYDHLHTYIHPHASTCTHPWIYNDIF